MTWLLTWLNESVATLNATLQLLVIYRLDHVLGGILIWEYSEVGCCCIPKLFLAYNHVTVTN